jgi:hypothetical protein
MFCSVADQIEQAQLDLRTLMTPRDFPSFKCLFHAVENLTRSDKYRRARSGRERIVNDKGRYYSLSSDANLKKLQAFSYRS